MGKVAETERAERLRKLADELRTRPIPYPRGRFSGRGIVIVAGGALMFTNAYVLISVLRTTLASRLPIELWYFGREEISPAMAALLRSFDVELVDALPLFEEHHANIRDGWQLKSFAMAWCRFEEVLLLDADQVPVVDPAVVFEWPEYRRDGAVFWPDIVDIRADNAVWGAMGLPAERVVSLESGQALVDKRRHWRALSIVVSLNEAADDLYQLIYGDKDTFLLGWALADEAFALIPHPPFADEFFLVQRTFSGGRLFQHLTNAKWHYAGVPRPLMGIEHEEACGRALDVLRSSWSGRVFNAPDRGATARVVEGELITSRLFEIDIAGERPVEIELRPFGEVGLGHDYDRRFWWVEEGPTALRLMLSDGQRSTYVLDRQPQGNWRGHRSRTPQRQIEMCSIPEVAAPSNTLSVAPGMVDDLLQASGFRHADAVAFSTLTEAFKVLSRVLPGTPNRLRKLAELELDEDTRRRLLQLAASTSFGLEVSHQDVVKDATLLIRGYQRAGGAIAE